MSVPLELPLVRHTFLSFRPLPLGDELRPRSRSLPVEGTCDPFAREVHTLMFKVCPVQRPASGRCWTGPRALAAGEEAVPSAISSVEHDEGLRRLGGAASCSTRGASEDLSACSIDGISDAELDASVASLPEQELEPEFRETLESVLSRVPRDEDGGPLSLGSLRHAFGDCRPCAYHASRHKPCVNGVRCSFCHLQHPPKRRSRLCRRKRLGMREIVASVIAGAGAQGVPPAPKYVPICWPVRAARDSGVLDDFNLA